MDSSKEISIESRESYRNKKNNKKKMIIISVITVFLIIGMASFILYPRLKVKGDLETKIKLDSEYVESGAIAKIAGIDISNKVKIKGTIDTSKVGKYEIEYSVKEGIFTNRVKRIVEVIDDVEPTIELKGNINSIVCPNKEYVEEGYTATDNYDGDITSKVVTDQNENEINYTVVDSSGNKSTVKRTIEKKDAEKPKITLNGKDKEYVLIGGKYNDSGVKVVDNCDGDITSKVTKSGSVNTSKSGTYKIKYQVTDEAGNLSSVERSVVVYSQGVNKSGVIYLTFDDGPSSSITPGVLKILKQKGVKATFFVIGCSSSLDYLIKQEYNEGHVVALHSYTHNYKTVYSSYDAYFNDLQKISNKVKSIIGVESKIIRFPGGSSNTVSRQYNKGIMTYLTKEVIKRGYHYFDWNVSSGDAGSAQTKQQVYNNVVNGLVRNRNNVVLMHDYSNNYKTLNALSDIIDYGLANNYRFEVIDMNTPMVRHGVNN